MESKSREVLHQECEVMSVFAFGFEWLAFSLPSRNGIVFVLRSMFVRFFPLFPFHKIFINNNNEGFCMPQDEKERERERARLPEKGPKSWLVVFCVSQLQFSQ